MTFQGDIDKAQAQLKMLSSNVSLSLSEAAEQAADVMLESAKSKAPFRTGDLRDSIEKAAHEIRSDYAAWKVYAGVFYASYLEYGTRKMRKRPFMRPAFDESRAEMARIAEKVVKRKDGI